MRSIGIVPRRSGGSRCTDKIVQPARNRSRFLRVPNPCPACFPHQPIGPVESASRRRMLTEAAHANLTHMETSMARDLTKPEATIVLDLLEAFRRSKAMFVAVSLGV